MYPAQHVETAILGAGVAGLTAAHHLAATGEQVCLLDDYAVPGGNHKSLETDGMSFDVGAIFFWPHTPIFDLFPVLREGCVPVPWQTRRVTPDGAIRPYPFDIRSELFGRSPAFAIGALASMARARLGPLRKDSADTFLAYYLGPRVREMSGIDAFIERFYGRPASEISFDFATQRMQQIVRGTQVRTRLADAWTSHQRRRAAQRDLASATRPMALARPKSGFAAHYARAVDALAAQGVTVYLSAGLSAVERQDGGLRIVTRRGPIIARRVISTVPMELAARLLGLPVDTPPKSLSLTTLCCRFRGARGFDGPVLYNFNHQGRWKRLTVHSDYYGDADGWSYCSVETVSGPGTGAVRGQFDDFERSVRHHGLFSGDLELVDTMQTDFAYPLYDLGVEARRDALATALAEAGVETMGRQGRFQYHPTSADTVRDVQARLTPSAQISQPAQPVPETPGSPS